MKNFNLKDYLSMPRGKILKIKVKNQNNYIYGRLAGAGGLYPATLQGTPDAMPLGTLSKINDYGEFIKQPSEYKDYSLVNINSWDIEDIVVINA